MLSGLEVPDCSPEQQTRNTLIRLLLQKQSDLGQSSFSMPFLQATSDQNLITFTVMFMANEPRHEISNIVVCAMQHKA